MEELISTSQLIKVMESEKELSHFLTTFSHEFRTPLAIILLEIDQLLTRSKEKPELDLEFYKSVSHIKANTFWIAKVVNNIIAVTDAELGQLKAQITLFDVVKTINKITIVSKQVMKTNHLQFANNSGDKQLFIQADELLFERALLNLYSNAFKHTKRSETIYVTLDSDDTDITVSVKDQGEGIKKDGEQKNFKKYSSGVAEFASATEGLGIGLALVKEIIDLHHGRVWFNSTPGQGSKFFFSLPIDSDLERNDYSISRSLSLTDIVNLELAGCVEKYK